LILLLQGHSDASRSFIGLTVFSLTGGDHPSMGPGLKAILCGVAGLASGWIMLIRPKPTKEFTTETSSSDLEPLLEAGE